MKNHDNKAQNKHLGSRDSHGPILFTFPKGGEHVYESDVFPYDERKVFNNLPLFLILKRLLDIRVTRHNFDNPIELLHEDIFVLVKYDSYQNMHFLIEIVQNDIDFYKKFDMQGYTPDVGPSVRFGDISFTDFTKEFLEKYLDFRFGPVDSSGIEKLEKYIEIGFLTYKIDDGVYFKGKNIDMRPQMKKLCMLFMQNHKEFVEYPTIKDRIIPAHKRKDIDIKTIEKYVSELHKILKPYFKKDVIFNDRSEGYIFDTEKNS